MEINIPIPKGRGFTPFPFGQCQICGAEATGNHYGANTCEGCKGFFKRSLPVFRSFRCFFGNKCEVSPDTRNRCKACRFRKCIEAGMALDAVKMGRIPKAVKESAVRAAGTGASSTVADGEASSPSSDNMAGPSGAQQNTPPSSSSMNSPVLLNNLTTMSPGVEKSAPTTARFSVIRASPQVMEAAVRDDDRVISGRAHYSQSASLPSPRFHPYYPPPIDRQRSQEQSEDDLAPYSLDHLPASYRAGPSRTAVHFAPAQAQKEEKNVAMDDCDQRLQYERSCPRTRDGYVFPSSNASSSRFTGSGGVCVDHRTSFPSLADRSYSQTHVKASHLPEVVDMAISGQTSSENNPELRALRPDQMSAEMATAETAVAVLEPSVQGKMDCAPVVPRDIVIMTPSYVPPDKVPVPPKPTNSNYHRHRKTRRDGSSSSESSMLSPIPHLPHELTCEFFHGLSHDEAAKRTMCEHTFRVTAKKNNEIYGEETRANEVFLKEVLTTGNLPHQPERTPLQMRDILKDRLVTQVKRVVRLSESIPGFRDLDMHDQHSLLRSCILDTWMVHSARFLREGQSYILFLETGTFYARYWMEQFLTDEFLTTVFEVASRINALDLSFDELSLLKCILIVRPDRPSIQRVDFITAMHTHLLDALKLAVRIRRPVAASQLLPDLMELLKGWRILDLMQEKYVHPIDLSHFTQGPWKVSEASTSPSHDGPSASTSQEGAALSRKVTEMASTAVEGARSTGCLTHSSQSNFRQSGS